MFCQFTPNRQADSASTDDQGFYLLQSILSFKRKWN
jgi:hypothetical protein